MDEEGGAPVVLDRVEVEKLITARVAPLQREMKRQRRRVAAVEGQVKQVETRVTQVETDMQTSLALVERMFGEGIGRIEVKLDKQHLEVVARLDKAEGWIGRRRRIELAALRVSQVAAVAAMRRWLPFFGLVLIVLASSWGLTIILGGML